MSTLLSPAEVVARLRISRQTLARWERSGQLVRDPSSTRPRFREADVDALARARADTPGTLAAVLRAAADLLQERGVDGCTLDAVAERAGLSRAGLVHHHPTKEHLFDALIRQFVEDFELAWRLAVQRQDPGPGRLCRAYVAVTLGAEGEGSGAAVLACALDSRSLRDLLGRHLRDWYDRLGEEDDADGLAGDGVRMCLAADGLWILRLLQVAPLDAGGQDRAFPKGQNPVGPGVRA